MRLYTSFGCRTKGAHFGKGFHTRQLPLLTHRYLMAKVGDQHGWDHPDYELLARAYLQLMRAANDGKLSRVSLYDKRRDLSSALGVSFRISELEVEQEERIHLYLHIH